MAMAHDSKTINTNSFDNNCHKLNTDAPNTLRTPISFTLCSATKEAKPKRPRQEMIIANPAKTVASLPICSSDANFEAYSLSANLYSNGADGIIFLKTVSILGN